MIASGQTVKIYSASGHKLSGGCNTRIFAVYGRLALSSLTLADGFVSTSACSAPYSLCSGGLAFVSSFGFLSLESCVLLNSAAYRGGALYLSSSGNFTTNYTTFRGNNATHVRGEWGPRAVLVRCSLLG